MGVNKTQILQDNYENPDVAETVYYIIIQLVSIVTTLWGVKKGCSTWKSANWCYLLFSNKDKWSIRKEKLLPEEQGEILNDTETSTDIELDSKIYHLKKRKKEKVVDETKEETKDETV